MAALLRSVAAKMARAPPRLPSALERHGRLSTPTASTPPPANHRGPQTHDKKDPTASGWYRAAVAFNEAASIAILSLWGSIAFMHFSIRPRLERLEANLDAASVGDHESEDIKKIHERTRSDKESQIEATDVSECKRITGIGY